MGRDFSGVSLKNAQRQWIYLRDADCELMAFEAEPGSQAHEGNVNQCITAATQLRSRQLREISSQLTPQEMIEQ
ncbi:lysozyme inhibitor LprI family protein [Enterobacterales bacterium AE_CKDN230030158-1A_HGKHYDSX7]